MSEASPSRSLSGFRLIWMRPTFEVMFVPSTPMNDETLATAGSRVTISVIRCCRSAMAANDTSSGASEMPRMTPVSCSGKKPFGTTM